MKHYKFSFLLLISFSLNAMDGPGNIPLINKRAELAKVRIYPLRDKKFDFGVITMGLALSLLGCYANYAGLETDDGERRLDGPLLVLGGVLLCIPIGNQIRRWCGRESGARAVSISVSQEKLDTLIKKYKKIIPKKQHNIQLLARLQNDKDYYLNQLQEIEELNCFPNELLVHIAEEAEGVNSHDIYKLVQQLFYASKIRTISRKYVTLKLKHNGHEVSIKDEFLEAWLYHLKKPGATKQLPRYCTWY